MEQLTLSFKDSNEVPLVKVPKNWGIRKVDLKKLNYDNLEDTFYGIHNLGVPIEMLDIENPDEIVANYVATGIMKRWNKHLDTDLPRDFLDLVRKMNEVAYKTNLRLLARDCKKRFSRNQQERLSGLDKSLQSTFVNSFFSCYRPSLKEEPSNPNAFYDPNADGRNKDIYISRIYDKIYDSFVTRHKKA